MLSLLPNSFLPCWSAENGACFLIRLNTDPFHFFSLFAVTMLFQMSQNDHRRCYIDLLDNVAGSGKDVSILYLELYTYVYVPPFLL